VSNVTQVRTGHDGRRVLELSRCALVVRAGELAGKRFTLDGDVFRVGKSRGNDLVLGDSAVSREHCEIVRHEDGFLLRDLGSTNGTLLDGAAIREGFLHEGAVITIGRVELEVQPYAERIDVTPSPRDRFGAVVGSDPAIREVFGLLERLAPTDATLLLEGETGTGKDLLARSVHDASKRAQAPFIVVDCGAVAGTLIESELFGHEKGAFTGAAERRQGAFELAHRGTLFLDEVGELPLELQPKLLRALEQRRIRRVGGSEELALDLRVIAASNRNLQREVERGKFRRDLYFRLAVVPVHLPPLRERRGDIAPVARHLLERIARDHGEGEAPMTLAPGAMSALEAHDWPGNVRELRNVLERASLLARAAGQREIGAGPLAIGAGPARSTPPEPDFDPAVSYRDTRAQWEAGFEARYVRWLLERHDGNVSAAARAAEMDRKYLHRLAKKHGLKE